MFSKENKNKDFKKVPLISKDTPLNVIGGKPINNAYVNTFFQLFSIDYIFAFERLYLELKDQTDQLYMSGEMFMRHAKDAYIRYQEYKKLDAFQPMDNKGFEYVERSLRKVIKLAIKANKEKP